MLRDIEVETYEGRSIGKIGLPWLPMKGCTIDLTDHPHVEEVDDRTTWWVEHVGFRPTSVEDPTYRMVCFVVVYLKGYDSDN